MTWFVPLVDGTPRPENGAFAAPPPGVECVEMTDLELLASLPEPEPEPDWNGFRDRLNSNSEWLELVDASGAASELARYVSLRDVANTRRYWLFLESKGRISETLRSAIAQASTECNLSDLFEEISTPE